MPGVSARPGWAQVLSDWPRFAQNGTLNGTLAASGSATVEQRLLAAGHTSPSRFAIVAATFTALAALGPVCASARAVGGQERVSEKSAQPTIVPEKVFSADPGGLPVSPTMS
jgi:hypothetical protein